MARTSPAEDRSATGYTVLARRYRPQTFEALVGQEHVARALRNGIASGRIAHAFLFTGIRGVGKTTAARLMARALNCQKTDQPTPNPCPDPRADSADACANCKEIALSSSVDVAEIDGASNRGIDSIRELNENVRYSPAKSRFRVYIIDEAHMVTREGFNALLKTLEEPPRHVKFIFATTAVDKFPDTIISRCQRYDFRRIPARTIAEQLGQIAEAEGVKLSPTARYRIAREAEGSMRDAESLLERLLAYSGDAIDESQISAVLGLAERGAILTIVDAVLERDPKRALETLDRIHAEGRDLERLSRDLVEHWRNLLIVRLYGDRGILTELADEEIEDLRRQAAKEEPIELERSVRAILKADEELRRSAYPRLVLEMLLVRLATREPIVPVTEIIERLDELSRGEAVPASAPRARTAPPSPRVPEPPIEQTSPVPAAPPVERERPRPTAPSPSESGESWNAFLEHIQERKLPVYLTMSHARPLRHEDGTLVLGVAREYWGKELRAMTPLIEEFGAEFYGRKIRVVIETITEEQAAAPKRENAASKAIEDPTVQLAQQILGAELREVREVRKR